jgi:hypothetical protein
VGKRVHVKSHSSNGVGVDAGVGPQGLELALMLELV